jgi:hypothetical protein
VCGAVDRQTDEREGERKRERERERERERAREARVLQGSVEDGTRWERERKTLVLGLCHLPPSVFPKPPQVSKLRQNLFV